MRAHQTYRVLLNQPVFKRMQVGGSKGQEPSGKNFSFAVIDQGRPTPHLLKVRYLLFDQNCRSIGLTHRTLVERRERIQGFVSRSLEITRGHGQAGLNKHPYPVRPYRGYYTTQVALRQLEEESMPGSMGNFTWQKRLNTATGSMQLHDLILAIRREAVMSSRVFRGSSFEAFRY